MTPDLTSFHAFEDLAKSIALRLIQRHEQFRAHPTPDGHGGVVIGWLRKFSRKGISHKAATLMLREDLDEAMQALRSKIVMVGQDQLGASRVAVLLHLAMLPEIGAARVLGWDALWAALSTANWNDAADALLLTEWPVVVGGARESMVRAVALQRVLRTGNQFTDLEERRIGASRAPQ